MPAGLQTLDAAGQLLVDIPHRLTRVLGMLQTGSGAGSVTNEALANGEFWYSIVPIAGATSRHLSPVVSYNAGTHTVSWAPIFGHAMAADNLLIYGTY